MACCNGCADGSAPCASQKNDWHARPVTSNSAQSTLTNASAVASAKQYRTMLQSSGYVNAMNGLDQLLAKYDPADVMVALMNVQNASKASTVISYLSSPDKLYSLATGIAQMKNLMTVWHNRGGGQENGNSGSNNSNSYTGADTSKGGKMKTHCSTSILMAPPLASSTTQMICGSPDSSTEERGILCDLARLCKTQMPSFFYGPFSTNKAYPKVSTFAYNGDPDFRAFTDVAAWVKVAEQMYAYSPSLSSAINPPVASQGGLVGGNSFLLPPMGFRPVMGVALDIKFTGGGTQDIPPDITSDITVDSMSTIYGDVVPRSFKGDFSFAWSHTLYIPFATRAPQTERMGDPIYTINDNEAEVRVTGFTPAFTLSVRQITPKSPAALDMLRTMRSVLLY